jgi:hypothetical protein
MTRETMPPATGAAVIMNRRGCADFEAQDDR